MNINLIIGVLGLILAIIAMFRYSQTKRAYYFWVFLFDAFVGSTFLAYAFVGAG